MSYYELWAILSNWRREFSSGEFARTFSSPNPRKLLHDMAKKGLLEHMGYGKYRVKSVGDYVRAKNDVRAGYELLRRAELPYELTDVDGVFVWTKGGYNADRFFGFYPIHLKVLRSDVVKWESFFHKAGKKSFLAGTKPKETLFGVFYVLYPEEKIEAEIVEDLKVEPLEKTLEFCRKYTYTFEPALEMLDEEYHLGLGVKYRKDWRSR
ncbi:MAG: hypothetical protein HXX80_03615 [Nitrososphaerales archaeon]|nr:hypothetical protein [Nitrososphaerales archaeon]